MPAWKREILERKRAKLAALGGGAALGAEAGEAEPAGPAAEKLVLAESLGPLRENPFMRLESERRLGARRGGSAGAAGPGVRPADIAGAVSPRAGRAHHPRGQHPHHRVGSRLPAGAQHRVRPGSEPQPGRRIRAAEVLVYEAPPLLAA
ncbi:Taperin [Camelus dromedarius]|uniref:Taperin n=1 Tax=Camelus dromedarius TaxID=9838 RepID=A0A5N4E8R1_CAMDR|nr:Taperin [Camelus dromedarius]